MIFTGTMLQVVLCWSVVAFSVATIVLAIDKAKLSADLNEANQKLDYLESGLVGDVQPRSTNQGVDTSTSSKVELDYRLPGALYPTHYDLYLHPNIDNGSFSGRVEIEVTAVEATEQIILHAHKLDIESVVVTTITDNYQLESNFQLDEEREFLIIHIKQKLWLSENFKVTIKFRGLMQNKIVGLYSSYYQTAAGERRGIATSKFEPTYARQAFPCFDEPAMKATFSVTLVQPNVAGYHALSNMNEEETIMLANLTEVRFAKSVPMSTYLACFIVSDFAHTSKTVRATGLDKNFDIRIFATTHQLSKTSFALDSAVAVTEFYINYFQLGYPLPKLDMAAIPDFVSNAMEHWGLVTYRETALLYDPTVSSTWNKQRIGAVVAHELAHMWFGNLVTMMWWNDLWLNEGFARYMEYKGNHEVYPEWGLPDQFLIHALHSVLKYDASLASHPIVQTVTNPDQITEMFDTISYEKGASIIRMLEDFVGEDKFRVAVGNYLSNFKFKNAVTNDFFGEVAKMGFDFDLNEIMRTWTMQMGLPVVNVARISKTEYRLTQKRFLANIEDYNVINIDSEFNYTWDIPITYQTDLDSSIQRIWLQHDDSFSTINVSADTKWIKLNAKQVGYYRINYAPENWQALIATLLQSPQSFAIADRAHLLNDVFALADASQLPYDIALDMTKYLAKEFDFVPWYVATAKLEALQTSLRYTDSFVDYLSYSRELIKKAYNDVGWIVDQNDHLRNRLRVSILTTACSLGLPECVLEASNRFVQWLAAPTEKPHPDLREIIYYYGMQRVGRESSWKQMWQIYKDEQDASEKTKLMYGLSGVREPWLLHRFVELAADEQHVRRQDYFNCLQYIAANPAGEAVVWDYVRDHWQDLVRRFGLNERFLGRMIPTITERFSSVTKLEEMTAFFAKYPEAGAGTAARKQALETVKYNIKWLTENKEKVASWLQKNSGN